MELRENVSHPGGGLWCKNCGSFKIWLRLDKNKHRRENLPEHTLDDVWEKFGNHCSMCNMLRNDLEKLGIGPTIQHCPPYSEVGHDAQMIPLCRWCQEDATVSMNRMRKILNRMNPTSTSGDIKIYGPKI
jgi:hypothetical protein